MNKAFFFNTATDNENMYPSQICKKYYFFTAMAIKRNASASIIPLNN